MINFTFYTNPTLALACASADEPAYYSLEAAAQVSGVHPEMLRYYLRLGLIEAHRGAWEDELYFDRHALEEVQRLGHYRRHLGVSRRALPLICELRRASERQHIELRFLSTP
jgi:DNA-binding transcriptional MerR regulator